MYDEVDAENRSKWRKEGSVKSLKTTPFERRTLQGKLWVKELGPDQPDIMIKQQAQDRGRQFPPSFSRGWFVRSCG